MKWMSNPFVSEEEKCIHLDAGKDGEAMEQAMDVSFEVITEKTKKKEQVR